MNELLVIWVLKQLHEGCKRVVLITGKLTTKASNSIRRALNLAICLSLVFSCFALNGTAAPKSPPAAKPATAKPPAHPDESRSDSQADKDKKESASKTSTPEPVLENVVSVNPDELVAKPQEYLGKNVKFSASFFAFTSIALDYKPAFRSSKTHLSFLILKPGSHIPLSELKLAMMIPKEKDPENTMLATLKDGDQLELIGKVFSTALDDPWVEIFKVKKIGGSSEEKKTVATGGDGSKPTEAKPEKASDTKSEKPADDKSETPAKAPPKN